MRYALRGLTQSPGFFLTAVLAIGLGIGANTAMFSVVDGVLLKPLLYDDPERLVNVMELFPRRAAQGSSDAIPIPPANFWDYFNGQQFFETFAAYRRSPLSLSMPNADPERHLGVGVTRQFFDVLRVKPILGRLFDDKEMEPGTDSVVLMSHGLWMQRFGGDPNILGRKLTLSGRDREVIGVLPPGFDYPSQIKLWVPLAFTQFDRERREMHTLYGLARLKPEASIEQARAQMQSVLNRIALEVPDYAKGKLVLVTSMADDLTGKVKPALIALLGAVAFVLAIACANVANLLLARGAVRHQELAIRAALGAQRGRLIRQMLTESLLIGTIGGLLGLALAFAAFYALKALAPPNLPRLDQIAIDGRVLLFTLGTALLTSLVFGLIPALRLSRVNLHDSLKERSRGSTSRSGLHGALVVVQVAAAVVLLTGAGLLTHSLYSLLQVDIGFNPDRLMTMRLTPLLTKYVNDVPGQIQLGRNIMEKVKSVPGVVNAGFSTDLPLLGNPRYAVRFEGFPPVTAANSPFVDLFTVSPDYFSTMGIRLQKGRFFTDADDARSPLVCIANEQLVQTYFPRESPIGRRLQIGFSEPPKWRIIVGVVDNVRNVDLEKPAPVQLYCPYYQKPSPIDGSVPSISVVARVAGDAAPYAEPIRKAVLAADNAQPVFAVQTMNDVVSTNISQRRFSLVLMGVFAVVALILAVIGLTGVISYMVTQRTQEIGIRVALGAQTSNIVWMVESHSLLLVGIGLAVGIIGSLLTARAIETILYQVSPYDPITLLGVVLLLIAVAALAGYLPARRASRIDPVVALRQE